jgi:hypothetical protein
MGVFTAAKFFFQQAKDYLVCGWPWSVEQCGASLAALTRACHVPAVSATFSDFRRGNAPPHF